MLTAGVPKSPAHDPRKNMGTMPVHNCKWPTAIALRQKGQYLSILSMMRKTPQHLARSFLVAACTHNQALVKKFFAQTAVALNNWDFNMLQFVSGGCLDVISFSPAWGSREHIP